MPFIEPVTLAGPSWVTLEPLDVGHEAGLRGAAIDGEGWNLWYTGVPEPDAVGAYIASALAMRRDQGALPFVARRKADGAVVGTTRFFHVDAANRRLEIGHTWYAQSARRTGINTEAKLLLLTHAFESLGCIAVEFRTHFFNFASREAIARLGAKQDGILRSHQILADGSLRDTVVFSIIAPEWPAVRAHLLWQLARPRPPSRRRPAADLPLKSTMSPTGRIDAGPRK
ncbi:GNAT family N-acetyltransferase [Tundrisphaera sp. TA3]|uniref:GNAT family N-acetyltransferase n=1 Tax=Tundrisphaera sp. TA3 TaxID=3435775 RepID=UPI003EB7721E